MIKLLGLFAGSLFAYAAVPQAIATLRSRRKLGTPRSIIWAILGGTIMMYCYLLLAHGWDWVLTLVYGIEAASWAVLFIFDLKS